MLPEKALLVASVVGVGVGAAVVGVLVVEVVLVVLVDALGEEMAVEVEVVVCFRMPFRGAGAVNTVSGTVVGCALEGLCLLLLSSMLSFCVDAARLSALPLVFVTLAAGLP